MNSRVVALVVVLALAPTAAAAQEMVSGQTPGGAYYQIQMPAVWNGELVIWNHGLSMAEPAADPDLGVLAVVQLAQGYAVAASSYRQVGWAVFKTVPDMRAMVKAFESRFGRPQRVLLYGASLGGIVTAQLLEKGKLGNVGGGLIWCGATAGSRNWDGALDVRLAYDAVCKGVPGGEIPGGAEGLPVDSELTDAEIADSVEACLGVAAGARRTPQQDERLQQLLDATGIAEEFIPTDMWYVTRVMQDLVHDRKKMKGKLGTDNQGVEYPDAVVDAAIERVKAKKGGKRRLAKFYTPTGAIGDARVLSIHTDGDDLVVPENMSDYHAKLPDGQHGLGIVVEDTPSHCGFTTAEALASWDEFLDFVDGGPAPDAADLQSRCEQVVAAGTPGPCRFDPDYELGSLDDRIPPR